MRLVIQRVSEASVSIDGNVHGSIGLGLMILVGVEQDDTPKDADWLVQKVAQLRIFSDGAGLMNLNVHQVHGAVLTISQFTLQASYKKGNRPSFIRAARPELAAPLYDYFNGALGKALGQPVMTGIFGADMQVSLVNDGPVTIIMDSKHPE